MTASNGGDAATAATDTGNGTGQQSTSHDGNQNGSTFNAPASQADLDRLIDQRISKVKASYGMTPDEAKQFKEQFEALDTEGKSEAERQAKEARKAAESEKDAFYRPKLAETAFRVAIGDRKPHAEVDDFIADLNLARFLTDDGQVDTAKVLARVQQFAPSTTSTTQQTPAPRGPVIPGHNSGTAPTVKPGDSARAALAARGIKVD